MFYPEDENQGGNPAEETPKPGNSAENKPAGQEVTPKAEKKADKEVPPAEESSKQEKPEKAAKPESDKKEQKKSKKDDSKGGKKEDKGDKKKDKGGKSPEKLPEGYVPRMLALYKEKCISSLMKRFSYKNQMMVPRLQKIVLNVGIGDASANPKVLESAAQELALVSGQKAKITKARKSISNFKLREGMDIGCSVTLRGFRMWEFLDRLMTIVIPRMRDFRGLSDKSFDGRGNYTFGIKEQIVFPEIDIDKIERVHGLDISLVTTAHTDEEAHALMQEMGWPFRNKPQSSGQAA